MVADQQQPDEWYKNRLKDNEDRSSEDIDAPIEDELDDEHAADAAAGALVPVVPITAPQVGWNRCIAHVGTGSHQLKIYFNHFPSSSVQRGFINCPRHACIRYRPVSGTKELFAAEMYA